MIEVAPPAPAERRRIAALLCADEPRASLANFEALDAKATNGFSGSDLAELYRSASRARLRRTLQGGGKLLPKTLPPLNTSDWRDAARRILVSRKPSEQVDSRLRRLLLSND